MIGQAYSIIQVKEAKGHRLLNIRNPWGNFEWFGDWSDHSKLWTKDIIEIIQPVFNENDGCFWMSFKDFCKFFDSLDVCRLRNWDEARIRGRFIRYSDPINPTAEIA